MSAQAPQPASFPSPARQKVYARFAWFLAGSVLNYLLISTPFKWLKNHTQLPDFSIAACSIGLSAVCFFFWNYFVNFRTDRRRRNALPRYITAVGCMWLLSTSLLWLMKKFDARMALQIVGYHLDLDIVATQFFLGGLKFLLYHKWVFPVSKTTPVTNPAEPAPL